MTTPKLLTFQEACAYLQLSEKTLRQLIARGEIPAGKVGGTWRLRQAEIDAYFERQCAAAAPQPFASGARKRALPAPGKEEMPWERVLREDRETRAAARAAKRNGGRQP